MRAPYNVLVLPFCRTSDDILYCILKRKDLGIWQFVAGGGEGEEAPPAAARREAYEEAGIPATLEYRQLASMCHVPVDQFSAEARRHWGQKYVIPVYSFAVELDHPKIRISREHTGFRWCTYTEAVQLLHFDLDRTALYELKERIRNSQWEVQPSV